MKVALIQIDTVQGGVDANARKVLEGVRWAAGAGARVAVFPELTLPGYCPRDLLYKRSFRRRLAEAEDRVAARIPPGLDVVFGSIREARAQEGGRLHNVAVACTAEGRTVVPKTLLPNYDVFDEARYFDRGRNTRPVIVGGRPCAVTICEDIWAGSQGDPGMPIYALDPARALVDAGAAWLLNISASPFHEGKPGLRERLVQRRARELKVPIVLANLVGGNDEVLFDGHSLAVAEDGRTMARAEGFAEDRLVVDLDSEEEACRLDESEAAELERLRRALVMGLKDYARKSGFATAVLGLSGGIDSALSCVLAVEALGPENVWAIAMPSRYSAPISVEDARALAAGVGCHFDVVPIEDVFSTALATLEPSLRGGDEDAAAENLQPRIRGLFLMAQSNAHGHLVVSTGNKSELSVGYCTLYGDMCGGLAVISDVPKTRVFALARHLNGALGGPIPERTLTRPPSAELRPGQLDTDSLPRYEVLDDILARAIERGEGPEEIVAAGHDPDVVRDVLDRLWRNEYKRKQMPPGLKVTSKAFGVGRRMPITGDVGWFERDEEESR